MACKCGSQIVLCNLPIRFDTYVGCSHGCRYCFVQKKNGQLEAVKKGDTVESLKALAIRHSLGRSLQVVEKQPRFGE